MTKKWKQSELNRIYRDNPELKKAPLVGIDVIVVEFLKLHDVAARPPKDKSRRDGAIAGAITGAFGADVGGDAFLIQGQKTQTQQQEWTSWNQWALSHKDFPEYKAKFNGEAEAKNKEIDKTLADPAFIEKWEAYFKEARDKEFVKKQKAMKGRAYALIALFVIIGTLIGIGNSPEAQKFLNIEGSEYKK